MDQTSVNQAKIQMINRSLFLNLLRQEGLCSRATLAKLSGLRQATITNIVGELIHSGLVVETGLIAGEKNRRSIGLTLNDERFQVIGVHLTRQTCTACLMGLSGKLYDKWECPIVPEEQGEAALERVRTMIQTIVREHSDAEILSAGVAVPGPYQESEDRLLFVTGMPGWQDCPVRETLSRGLDLPLYILNDANAGAFAQLWYNSHDAHTQNMVYILAGQGIGCGMIVDGKLLLGQQSLAGEFGHSSIQFDGPICACGNRGCLEQYGSMRALFERISEQLDHGAISRLHRNCLNVHALSQAIKNGDRVASDAYRYVCGFLAMGIVSLMNQLNPGKIVIGDQLAEIYPEMMLDVITKSVESRTNALLAGNIVVEVNQLHPNPSLLGAGAYAVHRELEKPARLLTAVTRHTILYSSRRELA